MSRAVGISAEHTAFYHFSQATLLANPFLRLTSERHYIVTEYWQFQLELLILTLVLVVASLQLNFTKSMKSLDLWEPLWVISLLLELFRSLTSLIRTVYELYLIHKAMYFLYSSSNSQ